MINMKKYLMLGIAVSSLMIGASSCSHDSDGTYVSQVESDYRANFVKAFGEPASNQDWGFGTVTDNARMTRSNAIVDGDPFTFESTESYYINSVEEIPASAKTMSEIEAACKREDWGGQIDYNAMQNYKEFKMPEGTYSIHLWSGEHNFYAYGGTVTLNVTNANSINQARIYVLPQTTLNLNMDNYINDLQIYVANGATLNYNAEKLYKQGNNDGGKIYNHGTLNLKKSNFEINQNAILYNEGDMSGVDITSKPGDGHKSFFYNFGDLKLTGKMVLNSCSNFYNGGNVSVADVTSVTQQNIYWINNGHYVTGTMMFSAKNTTFYNFCQLIVQGNCNFTDGEFNLMNNSYTECNTGIFNNFYINMGNNSCLNVLNGSKWGRQGQGTYQGFKAFNDDAEILVRLGGETSVPSHNGAAFHVQGANLTLAYKSLTFYNEMIGSPSVHSNYSDISYADPTTKEELEANNDGRTTWDLHNVTKIVTGDDFDLVTVNTVQGQCAATWYIPGGEGGGEQPVPTVRVIAEDLSAAESSDFDFNDVVFDVTYTSETTATITLQAAGGTLPLTVADREVHQLFKVATNVMVNTVRDASKSQGAQWASKDPVSFDISGIDMSQNGKDIQIKVQKGGVWYTLEAQEGVPAAKIAVKPTFTWCDEFEAIETRYPKFKDWVQNKDVIWY